LIPSENGYSFFSKHLLAGFLAELQAQQYHLTSRLVIPSGIDPLWTQRYMLYRVEVSTGKSQKALLDEAEESLSRYPMVTDRLPSLLYPFNSIISYAVVANLYIYVQETLQEKGCVNSNPRMSLLRCAVLASMSPVNNLSSPSGLDIPNQENLHGMANLLLRHGADLKALYEGMTPFQLLFKDCFEGYGGGGSIRITKGMLAVASALLGRGQNPNLNIVVGRKNRTKCKALHVANNIEMALLLLRHKADVNAVDEYGFTPLDICVGVAGNPYQLGGQGNPEDAIQMALLLLNNGACITEAGQGALGVFISALEGAGCEKMDLDRIKISPLLPRRHRVVLAVTNSSNC
jgi:hypothetical protein